ncbi:MAG: hypothetical protein KIT54_08395 [Phycisphaeraceae bacterium]|nr:hypothetical protein [Phycisphaeraceae bacterium]
MGGAKKSEAVLFDMKWTVDDLNRVVQAERGELGSGSIATLAEDENWTLTTVGGWALHTLDGDVDGDDRWLHLVYDDRWRAVAEHWDDEAKPHAIYVHHAGGVAGSGSYIDELAFRERDADNDTNQVLEERRYYAQNWRKDVVAMLTHDGAMVEQVRYSSYGVPFGLPAGDTDSDGDFDLDDVNAITGSYDVRKDANLDGVVDVFDIIHAGNMAGGGGFVTTGRDVLGSVANANHFGYGVYLRDPAVPQWHVRHRVLRSNIGRWLTRDPAGYVDGLSLYEYVGSSAFSYYDPYGLGRVRNWLENWWNNTKEGWEGVKEYWLDPSPSQPLPTYAKGCFVLSGACFGAATKGKGARILEVCSIGMGANQVFGGGTGYPLIDEALNSFLLGVGGGRVGREGVDYLVRPRPREVPFNVR